MAIVKEASLGEAAEALTRDVEAPEERVRVLEAAIRKLLDYNVSIRNGEINYRAEDHIAVAIEALGGETTAERAAYDGWSNQQLRNEVTRLRKARNDAERLILKCERLIIDLDRIIEEALEARIRLVK